MLASKNRNSCTDSHRQPPTDLQAHGVHFCLQPTPLPGAEMLLVVMVTAMVRGQTQNQCCAAYLIRGIERWKPAWTG